MYLLIIDDVERGLITHVCERKRIVEDAVTAAVDRRIPHSRMWLHKIKSTHNVSAFMDKRFNKRVLKQAKKSSQHAEGSAVIVEMDPKKKKTVEIKATAPATAKKPAKKAGKK